MYTLLLSGGSNVMLANFTPEGVLDLIEKHQITDILLVPTMIQAVVDHPSIASYDTRSLRRIVYGASPMNEALIGRALEAFPNARFAQAYGMTELSPIATVLHHENHVGEQRERGCHVSVGRPTFGVEVRVVDENDQPVPTGTVGEIAVRGDSVMMGYWNKPEETRQAKRGGWMHTGDGGRMDEVGFIFLADRIKDMIISGGENVYSIEVENVMAKFPGVARCAVIGIPHEKWGEQVHAAIVPKPGETIEVEPLIAFCKQSIAGYKVPRTIEVVDALPLSGRARFSSTNCGRNTQTRSEFASMRIARRWCLAPSPVLQFANNVGSFPPVAMAGNFSGLETESSPGRSAVSAPLPGGKASRTSSTGCWPVYISKPPPQTMTCPLM